MLLVEVPTLPSSTPRLMNSSCYNKVDNCDLYSQDVCSSYRPWAMEHCNMYCGFCSGNYVFILICKLV